MNRILRIMVIVAYVLNGVNMCAADHILEGEIKNFLNSTETAGANHTQGYAYCSQPGYRTWLYDHMNKHHMPSIKRQISLGTTTAGKERIAHMHLSCDILGENKSLKITEIYEQLTPGRCYNTIKQRSAVSTWKDWAGKNMFLNPDDEQETSTTYRSLTTLGKCCIAGAVAGVALAWNHREMLTKLVRGAQKVKVLA